MTKTNLAELKIAAEAASQGVWSRGIEEGYDETQSWVYCKGHGQTKDRVWFFTEEKKKAVQQALFDAEYIFTASPQTILALISEIEEKTKALEFYANKENWDSCDAGSVIDDEDNDHDTIIQYFVKYVGGKQARTVLTKWSRS